MKDKLSYIEIDDKKYPMAFNLNVMEELQEKYGSISAWGEVVEGNGTEPKIKDLKVGLELMINEGIDIENETREEKEPLLNSKQIGRLLSKVGFVEITNKIKELTVMSTRVEEDEEKNV